MSWNPSTDPNCPPTDGADMIETVIVPRARDIGAFEVRRALPAAKRRMVGPFIFFDQMGPVEFLKGEGIDVRPHPHIGLATVTYLFEGSLRHQDSLGVDQVIRPGALNLMVAGRGVTHSERTSPEARAEPHSLAGIQTWLALPERHEDDAPDFAHVEESRLPVIEAEGKRIRLIMGSAWGERAPVKTFAEMFYADAILAPGAVAPLPGEHEDRGFYVLEGDVEVAGQAFDAGKMAVLRPGDAIDLVAGDAGARVLLLGGETLGGPRHIWWNFVASSKERIEQAKADWAKADFEDGRFKLPPNDADEFIKAPD